jgi:hypothetical protein
MSARITHRQILLGAAVMAWWEFVTFIYVYAHDQGHDAPVTVYFFMGSWVIPVIAIGAAIRAFLTLAGIEDRSARENRSR